MLARSHTTCPHCGQSLPPPASVFAGLGLSLGETRLAELIRRAGAHGISGRRLFDDQYGGDSDGGPASGMAVIRTRISMANKKLRRIGKVLRAQKGGRGDSAGDRAYVLRDVS